MQSTCHSPGGLATKIERERDREREREGGQNRKNYHAFKLCNQFLEIRWHVASCVVFLAFDWYFAQTLMCCRCCQLSTGLGVQLTVTLNIVAQIGLLQFEVIFAQKCLFSHYILEVRQYMNR